LSDTDILAQTDTTNMTDITKMIPDIANRTRLKSQYCQYQNFTADTNTEVPNNGFIVKLLRWHRYNMARNHIYYHQQSQELWW